MYTRERPPRPPPSSSRSISSSSRVALQHCSAGRSVTPAAGATSTSDLRSFKYVTTGCRSNFDKTQSSELKAKKKYSIYLKCRGRSSWTRNWKLKPNKNVAFSFLYIQAGKIEKLDQRLKRWRVIELRKQCFTAHKAAAALSLTSHCRWAGQSLV